jgi:hypothetical protein
MKFLAISLIVHAPDPITSGQKSTTERFREVIGKPGLQPVFADLGGPGAAPRPPWPDTPGADPALASPAT